MIEPTPFPADERRAVGRFVKVCRHAECLWLEVKSVTPDGKKMVATIANKPLSWPYSMGDAVEISKDEITDIWHERPA